MELVIRASVIFWFLGLVVESPPRGAPFSPPTLMPTASPRWRTSPMLLGSQRAGVGPDRVVNTWPLISSSPGSGPRPMWPAE